MIGSWHSQLGSETITLVVDQAADGCALSRRQTSAVKATSFETMMYVAENGEINELLVYHNGNIERYRWWQNEEEWIAEQIGKAGAIKQRIIVNFENETQFLSTVEQSVDWGENWSSSAETQVFEHQETSEEKPSTAE